MQSVQTLNHHHQSFGLRHPHTIQKKWNFDCFSRWRWNSFLFFFGSAINFRQLPRQCMLAGLTVEEGVKRVLFVALLQFNSFVLFLVFLPTISVELKLNSTLTCRLPVLLHWRRLMDCTVTEECSISNSYPFNRPKGVERENCIESFPFNLNDSPRNNPPPHQADRWTMII